MRPRLRRFVAGFSLANYLLLSVGIPLPVPAAVTASTQKDTSRPFPCQHHRCGCASADQCWRQCCCFTHEEKLAWAAANDVVPPAELLAESAHDEHHDEHVSCAAHDHDAVTSCCQDKKDCDHHHDVLVATANDAPATKVEQAEERRTVIGLNALRCHSGTGVWLFLTATVLPLEPLDSSAELSPGEWLVLADSLISCVILTLDTPPPRA